MPRDRQGRIYYEGQSRTRGHGWKLHIHTSHMKKKKKSIHMNSKEVERTKQKLWIYTPYEGSK